MIKQIIVKQSLNFLFFTKQNKLTQYQCYRNFLYTKLQKQIQQYKSVKLQMFSQNSAQKTAANRNPLPEPSKQSKQTNHYSNIYQYTINSKEEQHILLSNLKWRQSTSMPVIKVVSFNKQNIQHSSDRYPCQYVIEIQNIMKDVCMLKNIDIGEAVYIIKQGLLGMQTLLLKFNSQFQINKSFLGINSKGQLKVWLSQNFMTFFNDISGSITSNLSKASGSGKITQTVEYLFKYVQSSVENVSKTIFKYFKQRILRQQNFTYSEIHNKIKKVCSQLKIIIPNCINLQSNQIRKLNVAKRNNMKYSHQKISKSKYGSIMKDNMSPYFLRRQYVDSINQSIKKQQQILSRNISPESISINFNKIQPKFKSIKPTRVHQKCDSKYTNSIMRDYNQKRTQRSILPYNIAKNPINLNRKLNSELKKEPLTIRHHTKIYKNLLHSQNIHNLKKQARQSYRNEIKIKQFNPFTCPASQLNPLKQQDQSYQIEETPTIRIQIHNPIELSEVKTLQTKYEEESKINQIDEQSFAINAYKINKNSIATTNLSNCTNRSHLMFGKQESSSKMKLFQMVSTEKNIMDSIMVEAPAISYRYEQSSRTYDFGGLIPIMNELLGQNGEISGKQVQSLQASRDQAYQNIDKSLENVGDKKQESINQKHQQKFKIDFDLLCGTNIMTKFLTQDPQDLKQSVWCGDEKKASFLNIKLEKLGKFGREICKSYMPNEQS